MAAASVRSETSRKMRAMKHGIHLGWSEGAIHGKIPILSPILGAIRGWYRTTIIILKEDLAS
jgi:hypothetical protein